jgi:hypothetical protein
MRGNKKKNKRGKKRRRKLGVSLKGEWEHCIGGIILGTHTPRRVTTHSQETNAYSYTSCKKQPCWVSEKDATALG